MFGEALEDLESCGQSELLRELEASIMTGTVQSVALQGRPSHRSWRRGQEVRVSPEDMQELLPTPLEMHKVGAGLGKGGLDARPSAVRSHCGLQKHISSGFSWE